MNTFTTKIQKIIRKIRSRRFQNLEEAGDIPMTILAPIPLRFRYSDSLNHPHIREGSLFGSSDGTPAPSTRPPTPTPTILSISSSRLAEPSSSIPDLSRTTLVTHREVTGWELLRETEEYVDFVLGEAPEIRWRTTKEWETDPHHEFPVCYRRKEVSRISKAERDAFFLS